MKLQQLLKMTEGFHRTCSISNLKRDSTTFITKDELLTRLVLCNYRRNYNLKVLVPEGMENRVHTNGIEFIPVKNVRRSFIEFHNHVNDEKERPSHILASSAVIHETTCLQDDGMDYAWADDGIVAMKHMGRINIGHNCRIGPYNTVVRASLDETRLSDGVCIGSHCNIGHNVTIGEHTMIHTHVCIAGSAFIGNHCWIGIGVLIRDHIHIADHVRLGAGTVVVKHIEESGTYVGNPARRISNEYIKDF